MRLDHEMLDLRGSASGERRFRRPAHLIAQMQRVYDFARFKLHIRHLKHAADDGRLLRAEQKTHGAVRPLNGLQRGGIAGLHFLASARASRSCAVRGGLAPGPKKASSRLRGGRTGSFFSAAKAEIPES